MATKHAIIKQIEGITFVAKADSNYWITMDGPAAFGGSDSAPRPKELLLMALGGCTASDVASVLKKKRCPLEHFEVRLTANAREEHPQIYTDIHIEYIFFGDDIEERDIIRAIELSLNQYCPVTAMIRETVNITHSYRIEPSRKPAGRQVTASVDA